MGVFDGPRRTLKANVTIVWGQLDQALDPHLCLEGIADYLVQGSQVILLPRTAHFTPIETEGRVALERTVQWAVDCEKEDIEVAVTSIYPGAILKVRK